MQIRLFAVVAIPLHKVNYLMDAINSVVAFVYLTGREKLEQVSIRDRLLFYYVHNIHHCAALSFSCGLHSSINNSPFTFTFFSIKVKLPRMQLNTPGFFTLKVSQLSHYW